MRAIAILALLVLSGCAAINPPVVAVKTMCLPLKAYTPEEQKAAAQAISALPPDSPIVGMVEDYKAMRDSDRACLKP
jgi:hypothetical protein